MNRELDELDELELGERVALALSRPKREVKKHLSECAVVWAKQFGWTEKVRCTCLDWSPEI